MRSNGTFRQSDLNRVVKAAKQAGVTLEIELEAGKAKIKLGNSGDKTAGSEQVPEAGDVVL
jgi:hypothetical protein